MTQGWGEGGRGCTFVAASLIPFLYHNGTACVRRSPVPGHRGPCGRFTELLRLTKHERHNRARLIKKIKTEIKKKWRNAKVPAPLRQFGGRILGSRTLCIFFVTLPSLLRPAHLLDGGYQGITTSPSLSSCIWPPLGRLNLAVRNNVAVLDSTCLLMFLVCPLVEECAAAKCRYSVEGPPMFRPQIKDYGSFAYGLSLPHGDVGPDWVRG